MDGSTVFGVLGGICALLLSRIDDEVWERYDIFNDYFTFPREHNHALDRLLMDPNHGVVKHKMLVSPGVYRPGPGRHYLYVIPDNNNLSISSMISKMHYIVLDKRVALINGREVYTYKGCIRFWSKLSHEILPFLTSSSSSPAIQFIENKLHAVQKDVIQTFHLDTSSFEPTLLATEKIYRSPWPFQERVAQHAVQKYQESKYQNVKLLLSGPKGVGKSNCPLVIKKMLEQKIPGVNPLLFNDFNPAVAGVNIQTLILSRATSLTPVIVVIDEFDIALDETVKEKEFTDSRLLHTLNKASFTKMLDLIGDTRYVIAVYTSEKSWNDLYSEKSRSCFVRQGRVDWQIEIDKDRNTTISEILNE